MSDRGRHATTDHSACRADAARIRLHVPPDRPGFNAHVFKPASFQELLTHIGSAKPVVGA